MSDLLLVAAEQRTFQRFGLCQKRTIRRLRQCLGRQKSTGIPRILRMLTSLAGTRSWLDGRAGKQARGSVPGFACRPSEDRGAAIRASATFPRRPGGAGESRIGLTQPSVNQSDAYDVTKVRVASWRNSAIIRELPTSCRKQLERVRERRWKLANLAVGHRRAERQRSQRHAVQVPAANAPAQGRPPEIRSISSTASSS